MEFVSDLNWTYEPELDPMLACPVNPAPGRLGGPFGFYVDFESNCLVKDNINLNLKLVLAMYSSPVRGSPMTIDTATFEPHPLGLGIDYSGDQMASSELDHATYFDIYSRLTESSSSDSLFSMSNDDLSEPETVHVEELEPKIPEPILTGASPIMERAQYRPKLVDLLRSQFSPEEIKLFGTCLLQCTHCTEEFHHHLDFALHLDRIRQNRPFKCPLKSCPWNVLGHTRKMDLRRHCMAHFPKGKAGREIETVLPEERQRIMEMVFPCHLNCGKYFYRKDSLKRHIKLLHENEGAKARKRAKK